MGILPFQKVSLILLFAILMKSVMSGFDTPKGMSLTDPPLNLHSVPCDPPRFSDYNICTTERFYIYDHFPVELVNLWPKKDGELRKHYQMNSGTGKLVNATIGMHETHQFAAFTPIYERLLHDYRRTLDPDLATAFFIPYDIGFDAAIKKDSAKIRPHGCPHAEAVIALLENNTYFRRHRGFDHFVVQGLNQAMGNFNERPACKLFLKGFCENCTKLAIDTYENCGPSPHWHAIPFPSNFHWNSNLVSPPWAQPDQPRKYAVSFTGSTSSFSKKAVIIRKKMSADCEKHPECFNNLIKSHFDVKLSDAAKYVNLDSVFCLNPPGDMPTRKGYFDSILAGCIPVTTDHYSAYDQWLWHLGRDVHDKTSLYIHKSQFMSKDFDFMQHLVDLVHEWTAQGGGSGGGGGRVGELRRNIAKYAARLQYRLPEHMPDSGTNSSARLPPRDATDVIIDRVFETNINVSALLAAPRDRGDWRSIDKFPHYPVGRFVSKFRLQKGEMRNITKENIQQWEHAFLRPTSH